MIEKLVAWIKKKDKEKFRVWVLRNLIAVLLPQWHLHRSPIKKKQNKESEIL